jgi:hypothetical protein
MKRLAQLRIFAVLAVIAIVLAVGAHASADTIVQSFKASSNIPPGWLVSLTSNSTNTVELTPANQSNDIFGVTIESSQAPITLQRQSDQQIYVANSGTYPVLVSTQNGPIYAGDYLSISSTSGIAAKAVSNQSVIVGQASQKFNGSSGVLSSSNGVKVGKISAVIDVEANPLLKNNIAVPSVIRKAGTSIAGRDISPTRIYLSLLIFVAAAALAFGVLIAGIRSSVISIGRNPLSKRPILRALSEVIISALLVLAMGVVAVYLLLKL